MPTVVYTSFLADVVIANALVFLASFVSDNCSLYDPYWSVAPPLLLGYFLSSSFTELTIRTILVCLLVGTWAVRLTYNCCEKWDSKCLYMWPIREDWRYQNIRKATGKLFWPVAYLAIHLMPSVLTWAGSLPLLAIVRSDEPLNLADIAFFALGFWALYVETCADLELSKFMNRPVKKNEILQTSVWKLCRHPNYLGECLFWVSLSALSVSATGGSIEGFNFYGSIGILVLFCFISTPLVEGRMARKGENWMAYKALVRSKVFPYLF